MKHLVDIDEAVLQRAKQELGLPTIKATVNAALRLVARRSERHDDLNSALDTLAEIEFEDRSAAWR
ncbi:type II toxin-antitoxin system VapB family antitoxin [Skermania sp. ID1734]|uniref:type II toxin-antitoxin system VapB family antitoxin n=1 Tax=Skermania sp. ID1734 TaxID=2597516 RepID=UPI002102296B|nr:type II toxin-antitoxin system VapB family antitoxin [Skermania sp. ID1734]